MSPQRHRAMKKIHNIFKYKFGISENLTESKYQNILHVPSNASYNLFGSYIYRSYKFIFGILRERELEVPGKLLIVVNRCTKYRQNVIF